MLRRNCVEIWGSSAGILEIPDASDGDVSGQKKGLVPQFPIHQIDETLASFAAPHVFGDHARG